MRCISPISIKDPRQKRGSIRMTVPCGKCGSCRHNRRIEWSYRIKEEFRYASSAIFLTLTYSDDNLKYGDVATLDKTDLQKFMKRLRKRNAKLTKQQLRYYAVGEYGTNTKRPHYHVIFFNLASSLLSSTEIIESWPFGQIHIGQITDATIHYITKYHVNFDKDQEGRAPEFATMSRRPGIGNQYIKRANNWHLDHGNVYIINNGFKQAMPRYYRDRIFSEDQRAVLAEEALANAQVDHSKECARLEALGIENPDQYIQNSNYLQSLKVESKAKEGNLF